MGTAPMGTAPCSVQPPGTSPPCSGATPGAGLVAVSCGRAGPGPWHHGTVTVTTSLHPRGTAGGLQGSSVGELSTDPGPLQRGPRVLPPRGCAHHPGAATRHPSACSTPKPPAAHPHGGAPQVLQETRVLGGHKSTSQHWVPLGPSPEPGSPPSCPVAPSPVPRAGSCHLGEPGAGRVPDGPAAQPGAHGQHYQPTAHQGASTGDSPRTGVSHLEPSTAWR